MNKQSNMFNPVRSNPHHKKKTDGKVFLFHSTRHESLFDNNLYMLCFCSICDIL